MAKPFTFHAETLEGTPTLAAALRQWAPEHSWSKVQQLIRKRHVLVNGNLCLDAGRRLKKTDVVRLLPHPTAPLPTENDVRIYYLDQHVVVASKPSGMTSVRHAEERHWSPKRKQIQPTLEELLPRVIAKKLAGGRKPKAPVKGKGRGAQAAPPKLPVRAVHRLDRETSGLMVFARTAVAERILGQQFRQHATTRLYVAVAAGRVEAMRIESNLVRDRGDGRRGSAPEGGAGKRAVTHVRPLENLGDYTLVECRLETGRTHQIRIHLSEQGHPLCGDKVYRGLRGRAIEDKSGAPRVALHAKSLGFTHPVTGENLSFEAPLPADLAEFIDRLRAVRDKHHG